MPREQVMCAGVSCGSAADGVGLAGASLKWFRSLISGARCYYSRREAASCYVTRLGSAIHGVLLNLLSDATEPFGRFFASVAALPRLWDLYFCSRRPG